ncbi:MAG: 2-oxoglutarate dehydrogenase complex dihydrolipoyllysine-residue succinyltransferase [Planctomycetota bacterium]|nr:2-oxoglutarate dehydrogenase complex dihydrolipoyllysine-residue succinyltransferase [Planctomycetota bacterium]
MPVEILMPQAGESVSSGVVSRWLKNPGDSVKRDETVIEVETDKVNLEVPAPSAGVIASHSVKPGDTVAIGQVLGMIDAEGAPAPAREPAPAAKAAAQPAPVATAPAAAPEGASADGGDVRATPLAKKLAQEHGVDLSKINGSGAGGRVREQDVLAFVESASSAAPARATPPAPQAARPAPSNGQPARERMSPLRQRIAQRLVQAQHTAAMLTTFNECDMGAVMDLRKRYKDDFEKKHAIGLGFMGFFVKATVQALRAFPLVNASIVDDNGHPAIERHDTCDIAVAVSTPKGLVVPVIRRCESLSMADIEKSIKDVATRARDGKLTLDEMQGGTFTITNGGVFGSLMSTPILNPPQSAILGMHTIKNRPVEYPAGSGQIALRPMMYLAVSYDHRLIDGAEAVQFLVAIKNAIEDPSRLLLGV